VGDNPALGIGVVRDFDPQASVYDKTFDGKKLIPCKGI